MTFYQGRALRSERPAPRRPRHPGLPHAKRVLHVLAILATAWGLAHLPWSAARARLTGPAVVRVVGARTLSAAGVTHVAALDDRPRDLLSLDVARVRQRLLAHPRIERATVRRAWPRTVDVRVTERMPVLLVKHGTTWELDSAGVLLAPPDDGMVADAPLLVGADFESLPAGTRITTPAVRRGLAWTKALGQPYPGLLPQVSEVNVGQASATTLVLIDGTRVLAPAWPPGRRELSALDVVLGDLRQRQTAAREIDIRYKGQVIVRPLSTAPALAATAPGAG